MVFIKHGLVGEDATILDKEISLKDLIKTKELLVLKDESIMPLKATMIHHMWQTYQSPPHVVVTEINRLMRMGVAEGVLPQINVALPTKKFLPFLGSSPRKNKNSQYWLLWQYSTVYEFLSY